MKRIVIIGSGAIGAALAYRLQGPEAQITVIDAGGTAATEASFGWINASFFLNVDHFRLRAAGIEAYATLAAELHLPVRATGCLSWEHSGAELAQHHARLEALGYPTERITPDRFRALEPAIADVPEQSLLFRTEAVAEPGALRQALLLAAQARGAKLMSGVRVTALAPSVMTTGGEVAADEVIVAAGTGSAALLAASGMTLPMLRRPAYVVETTPLPPVIAHVLSGPHGEVRQRSDGVLVAPAAVAHQSDAQEALDSSAEAAAEKTVARLRHLLPQQTFDWSRVTLAHRPVPGDDLPVIGRLDQGLYLAVMHSGITLAAVTADLVATEVLRGPTNATETLLSGFRPSRFDGLRQ